MQAAVGSRNLPLWIAALAMLFWGWELRLRGEALAFLLALPLSALLLSPRWVALRLNFSRTEFHRAFDVTWVLALGGLLLIYSQETVGNVLRSFAQWLPLVAFPVVLAQAWSTAGQVPTSALVPLPHWRRRLGAANPSVDVAPAFVAICLLSASATGGARPWFYIGVLAVLGAFLWAQRSHGARTWTAVTQFTIAAVCGWFLSVALVATLQWIETGVLVWTANLQRHSDASRESRTAIGRSGRVGGSDRIALRIRDEGGRPMPNLLRVATFSDWGIGTWTSARGSFEKVEGSIDQWLLGTGAEAESGMGIVYVEWVRSATDGLVPLPGATRMLRDFNAESVERSPFGTVRADVRGGVMAYRAQHAGSVPWELEPMEFDVGMGAVTSLERPVIRAVAADLGIDEELPPDEVLARVATWFQTQFRYTTDLVITPSTNTLATTSLGHFLLGHRSGHCEYFATAAVLLLRAAGIPARYATGYLIDGKERDGDLTVVRQSRAHAWVRVWKDGAWTDFDPTPVSDFEELSRGPGWWRKFLRKWHEIRFGIARWWWLAEKSLLRQAYWLALPLLAGLLWRFRQLRAASNAKRSAAEHSVRSWQGLDSEWFAIEAIMASRGWARGITEPLMAWRQRMSENGWRPALIEETLAALELHQRLRFDPRGLPATDRESLRQRATRLRHELSQPLSGT